MKPIKPFYDELNALYESLLKRSIDYSGYFTYASLLENGKHDIKEIEYILKRSDEYQSVR